jgi:hypothetical protein
VQVLKPPTSPAVRFNQRMYAFAAITPLLFSSTPLYWKNTWSANVHAVGGFFKAATPTRGSVEQAPYLKLILLLYLYITLASEAKTAMEDFVEWIKMQHVMTTNRNTNMENIVLAAHSEIMCIS